MIPEHQSLAFFYRNFINPLDRIFLKSKQQQALQYIKFLFQFFRIQKTVTHCDMSCFQSNFYECNLNQPHLHWV